MATVKENAEQYINKLYDATQDKQKQMLTDAYKVNTEALNTEKQNVQDQTNQYVERTNVEAQRVDQQYKPANVSPTVNQQAALTMENQQKKNTQMLQNQQQNANAEYERLRKLYADQFAAEIKKAQAENDKARAEQLYEAAKAKDRELQTFAYGMGELDNQALIDQIYNNATEAATQEINAQKAEKLSELAAQQEEQRRQTDENLTKVYVDALRKNQNMAEYQNARGMGSGNVAQARLARDMGTTEALTELRRAQLAADANLGTQRVEAGKAFADSLADVAAENERKRAQAMYAEALTQQPKAVASAGGVYRGTSTGTPASDGDEYTITNDPKGKFFVVGNKKLSYQQLLQGVENGTVKESVNEEKKTITYKMADSPELTANKKGSGGGAGVILKERR